MHTNARHPIQRHMFASCADPLSPCARIPHAPPKPRRVYISYSYLRRTCPSHLHSPVLDPINSPWSYQNQPHPIQPRPNPTLAPIHVHRRPYNPPAPNGPEPKCRAQMDPSPNRAQSSRAPVEPSPQPRPIHRAQSCRTPISPRPRPIQPSCEPSTPNPAESQSAHAPKPPSQQPRHQATKPVTQPATQPATQPPKHQATKPPSQPPSHWHPASHPPTQRTHPVNPPQTAFSTPLDLRDLVLRESVPIGTNNGRYWPAFLAFSLAMHTDSKRACLIVSVLGVWSASCFFPFVWLLWPSLCSYTPAEIAMST